MKDHDSPEYGGALVQSQQNGPTPRVQIWRCVYCNRKLTLPAEWDKPEWCPWGCEHQ